MGAVPKKRREPFLAKEIFPFSLMIHRRGIPGVDVSAARRAESIPADQ
jgi:hypothetical protein